MDCDAVRVCFINELSGDVCEYDEWVVVVLGAESSIVVWDLIYNVNPKWLAGILVLRLSNFLCTDIFEAEHLGNFQI